jgi:hypothetical protein
MAACLWERRALGFVTPNLNWPSSKPLVRFLEILSSFAKSLLDILACVVDHGGRHFFQAGSEASRFTARSIALYRARAWSDPSPFFTVCRGRLYELRQIADAQPLLNCADFLSARLPGSGWECTRTSMILGYDLREVGPCPNLTLRAPLPREDPWVPPILCLCLGGKNVTASWTTMYVNRSENALEGKRSVVNPFTDQRVYSARPFGSVKIAATIPSSCRLSP